jgi:hypothetical protein
MTRLRTAAWVVALVAMSCGAAHRAPSDDTPTAGPVDAGAFRPPEDELRSEIGQLQVFTPSHLSNDGRRIRVRGIVRNPYAQPVEGIRLVFRLLTRDAESAPELDSFQEVRRDRLEAGMQVPVSWDIYTMYAGMPGGGFKLEAFAVTRAGVAVPLPPDWLPRGSHE